ncbi:hypothetical protein GLAREA_12433 [Glarea lozoyensis ATCC 20868]|uniref:Uncharacterized protein n=1 Tax=Glarea lozoyensis (strain ATCC 20868 / MF5171) TaxID=1116229 RepID=S3CZH7_GLAL2|nr:uncharacterized protein GLAREA_12433 [Glarea lozoyensis ATCC 20868]EPE31677.1 hypothetical protein GLAREA_12433 [Glarea lozoyensis ATCC 20868]
MEIDSGSQMGGRTSGFFPGSSPVQFLPDISLHQDYGFPSTNLNGHATPSSITHHAQGGVRSSPKYLNTGYTPEVVGIAPNLDIGQMPIQSQHPNGHLSNFLNERQQQMQPSPYLYAVHGTFEDQMAQISCQPNSLPQSTHSSPSRRSPNGHISHSIRTDIGTPNGNGFRDPMTNSETVSPTNFTPANTQIDPTQLSFTSQGESMIANGGSFESAPSQMDYPNQQPDIQEMNRHPRVWDNSQGNSQTAMQGSFSSNAVNPHDYSVNDNATNPTTPIHLIDESRKRRASPISGPGPKRLHGASPLGRSFYNGSPNMAMNDNSAYINTNQVNNLPSAHWQHQGSDFKPAVPAGGFVASGQYEFSSTGPIKENTSNQYQHGPNQAALPPHHPAPLQMNHGGQFQVNSNAVPQTIPQAMNRPQGYHSPSNYPGTQSKPFENRWNFNNLSDSTIVPPANGQPGGLSRQKQLGDAIKFQDSYSAHQLPRRQNYMELSENRFSEMLLHGDDYGGSRTDPTSRKSNRGLIVEQPRNRDKRTSPADDLYTTPSYLLNRPHLKPNSGPSLSNTSKSRSKSVSAHYDSVRKKRSRSQARQIMEHMSPRARIQNLQAPNPKFAFAVQQPEKEKFIKPPETFVDTMPPKDVSSFLDTPKDMRNSSPVHQSGCSRSESENTPPLELALRKVPRGKHRKNSKETRSGSVKTKPVKAIPKENPSTPEGRRVDKPIDLCSPDSSDNDLPTLLVSKPMKERLPLISKTEINKGSKPGSYIFGLGTGITNQIRRLAGLRSVKTDEQKRQETSAKLIAKKEKEVDTVEIFGKDEALEEKKQEELQRKRNREKSAEASRLRREIAEQRERERLQRKKEKEMELLRENEKKAQEIKERNKARRDKENERRRLAELKERENLRQAAANKISEKRAREEEAKILKTLETQKIAQAQAKPAVSTNAQPLLKEQIAAIPIRKATITDLESEVAGVSKPAAEDVEMGDELFVEKNIPPTEDTIDDVYDGQTPLAKSKPTEPRSAAEAVARAKTRAPDTDNRGLWERIQDRDREAKAARIAKILEERRVRINAEKKEAEQAPVVKRLGPVAVGPAGSIRAPKPKPIVTPALPTTSALFPSFIPRPLDQPILEPLTARVPDIQQANAFNRPTNSISAPVNKPVFNVPDTNNEAKRAVQAERNRQQNETAAKKRENIARTKERERLVAEAREKGVVLSEVDLLNKLEAFMAAREDRMKRAARTKAAKKAAQEAPGGLSFEQQNCLDNDYDSGLEDKADDNEEVKRRKAEQQATKLRLKQLGAERNDRFRASAQKTCADDESDSDASVEDGSDDEEENAEDREDSEETLFEIDPENPAQPSTTAQTKLHPQAALPPTDPANTMRIYTFTKRNTKLGITDPPVVINTYTSLAEATTVFEEKVALWRNQQSVVTFSDNGGQGRTRRAEINFSKEPGWECVLFKIKIGYKSIDEAKTLCPNFTAPTPARCWSIEKTIDGLDTKTKPHSLWTDLNMANHEACNMLIELTKPDRVRHMDYIKWLETHNEMCEKFRSHRDEVGKEGGEFDVSLEVDKEGAPWLVNVFREVNIRVEEVEVKGPFS